MFTLNVLKHVTRPNVRVNGQMRECAKGLMEQSNREVMVHSFLPARSSYLRFTSVDRSVNENNHILIYVVFRNTVLLFYILHCSFNIF